MATNDVYKLTIVFSDTNNGRVYTTSIHGRQNVATAPDIGALGDDVKDWWNVGVGGASAMRGLYKTTTNLTRVTLRRVKPLEPVEFTYTTGLPIAGLDTSDVLDPGTAIVVSLRTANIGKSYRGRMYLPPTVEAIADANGTIATTYADEIADAMDGLFASLVVDRFQPAVYSRVLDTSADVTQIRVDRRFRHQRRRAIRNPLYVTP